ncbi:MAG: nuclear transport factor 2 family protein [Deltaproteobacteria bacterium]|nr:nuclear transport factor 2 family protein [Deltaproteobacteria bacterium]
MDNLQAFLKYAADFERTLVDDDWTRLEPYFADDAVYEVTGSKTACRLVGRPAIFAGMKKSLDGFDRKFPTRDIAVLDGPHVADDEIRMQWQVTYGKPGLKPFVLSGRGRVRYAGGKIVYLYDGYEPGVDEQFAAYVRDTGLAIDPSYV